MSDLPTGPWFKFWASRWRTSEAVLSMSAAQRGLYLSALLFQFDGGRVPVENEAVCKRALSHWADDWDRDWPIVAEQFPEGENPLMDEAREDAERRSEIGKNAGKASGKARRKKAKRTGVRTAVPNENEQEFEQLSEQRRGEERREEEKKRREEKTPPGGDARRNGSIPKPKTFEGFRDWQDDWCSAFLAATGAKYAWVGQKDTTLLKTIHGYAQGDREEYQRRVALLFERWQRGDDEWLAKNGIDFGIFKSQWSKLVSQRVSEWGF